jgi:hypothetical protein
MMVLLLRDPRGRPAGLPLWPDWKRMFGSPWLTFLRDGARREKVRLRAREKAAEKIQAIYRTSGRAKYRKGH